MFTLFEDRSIYPKRRAQMALQGRTHYVDDDTLRFFHSRILVCEITSDRLLCGIVESVACDSDNTKREFRPVVFDVFGTVLERPGIGNGYRTRAQAEKEMWAALNKIDAYTHTREAAKDRLQSLEREYNTFLDILRIAEKDAA